MRKKYVIIIQFIHIKTKYFENIFNEDFIQDSFLFLEGIKFFESNIFDNYKKDVIFIHIAEMFRKINKRKSKIVNTVINKVLNKNNNEDNNYNQLLDIILNDRLEEERKLKEEDDMFNELVELCNKERLFEILNILKKNPKLIKKFLQFKEEKLFKFEEMVLNYFLQEITKDENYKQMDNKNLNMKYKIEGKSVTLKFEKELNISLINFVSLIYETGMYPKWFPFCSNSEILKQPDKAKKLIYMLSNFPIISDRDFLVYGFGVNRIKENRTILLIVRSIDEESGLFKEYFDKKSNKKYVRAFINIFGFELTILNRNKLICKGIVNCDPKISYVPQSLLNMIGKKVIYNIINSLQKICLVR